MTENKNQKKQSRIERIIRQRRLENTHTYWFPLIVRKKDEPGKRKIKLESYSYTLLDIEYKDRRYNLEIVAKEFNQKMREKYDPDIYIVSPIFWNTLCLKREDAEKIRKEMIEKEKLALRESKKKT